MAHPRTTSSPPLRSPRALASSGPGAPAHRERGREVQPAAQDRGQRQPAPPVDEDRHPAMSIPAGDAHALPPKSRDACRTLSRPGAAFEDLSGNLRAALTSADAYGRGPVCLRKSVRWSWCASERYAEVGGRGATSRWTCGPWPARPIDVLEATVGICPSHLRPAVGRVHTTLGDQQCCQRGSGSAQKLPVAVTMSCWWMGVGTNWAP